MKLTIDEALKKGVEAHKAGRLQEADRFYTAILKVQTSHPDANHNMGVLAAGVGKVEQSLPFFKTALEANHSVAQYWLSYIDALIKLGKLDDARTLFNQATEKGIKGDAFDDLRQTMSGTNFASNKMSSNASFKKIGNSNILDMLKLDQANRLARKKLKAGLYQEAKSIYQDILAKFPNNKKANDGIKALVKKPISQHSKIEHPPKEKLQSLIDLYTKGHLKEASEAVAELLKLFPNSITLYNISGATNAGLKQYEKAIENFRRTLDFKADYAEAYCNIGNVLKEKGDLSAAIDSYKDAIKINPRYAEAHSSIGSLSKLKGDFDTAIKSYSKAIKIKPDYAEAHYNIGVVSSEMGNHKIAIEHYKRAIKIKPDYAEAYSNMGVALEVTGDSEAAVRSYQKAIEIKPSHERAYYNIGVLLDNQGDRVGAIEYYKKAIKIKPDYAEAYTNMGVVFHEMGDQEAAIQNYEKAIKINPGYADSYNNMGNCLRFSADLNTAIEYYKKATKINPDFFQAYNNLGAAQNDNGDSVAAIESFRRAIEIKPDYAEAYNNLGLALKDTGDLEAALNTYYHALKIKPDYAAVYNHLGLVFKEKGDLDAALKNYKRATELKPDYASAHCNMGLALKTKGELKAAVKSLEKAVDIKPDYGTAVHMLNSLLGKTPKAPPKDYVEKLFNYYATNFDHSLVEKLSYNIPETLTKLIRKESPDNLGSVLDLGCGTGLMGVELKPYCQYIEGIDLSQDMLRQAKKKTVYDKLSQNEIKDYLSANTFDFDYFVSTDVFIYVGDLTDIFRLIKSQNKSSGKLVFSTEHTEKDGFFLRQSGRYSHSKSYIQALCKKFKYRLAHFSTCNLRKDKGVFLTGGLYILNF